MTTHQVLYGDSVRALAARYYGDTSRWREIVAANDLRAPYISDSALDQYGLRLGVYTLAGAVAAGAVVVALVEATTLLRLGQRVVIEQRSTAGVATYDVALVDAVEGGAITLDTALATGYPAGAEIWVYAAPADLDGSVARPGDVLLIPGLALTVAQAQALAADRYGIDIAVDTAGRIQLTAVGDLDTIGAVSTENLRQQLRHRLGTEPGTLAMHPGYGCALGSIVGQSLSPVRLALAQGVVALALASDPRVEQVESVAVVVGGESVLINAVVVAGGERVDLSYEANP